MHQFDDGFSIDYDARMADRKVHALIELRVLGVVLRYTAERCPQQVSILVRLILGSDQVSVLRTCGSKVDERDCMQANHCTDVFGVHCRLNLQLLRDELQEIFGSTCRAGILGSERQR